MLDRLLILGAFVLVVLAATIIWRRYLELQARSVGREHLPEMLAALSLERGPVILYFTTSSCAQCRLQQTPVLAQVQALRGDLQIVKLDAVENQELSQHYHVLTVPTTVVLDSQHGLVAVNHGLATKEKLLEQTGWATGPSHHVASASQRMPSPI